MAALPGQIVIILAAALAGFAAGFLLGRRVGRRAGLAPLAALRLHKFKKVKKFSTYTIQEKKFSN